MKETNRGEVQALFKQLEKILFDCFKHIQNNTLTTKNGGFLS